MDKIKLEGYINMHEKKYTFLYENDRLSVISCEEDFKLIGYLKQINILEGKTTLGARVFFLINKEVRYINGYFEAYPEYVIFIRSNIEEDPIGINAIKFIGGDITRFYSNERIIENDVVDIPTTELILKDPKETVSTETCTINNKNVKLEFSVSKPGFLYDGKIKFGDINSNLRIKYNSKIDYLETIKDIEIIEKVLIVACASTNITYDKIDIEKLNEEGKYECIGNIYVPRMRQNSIIKNLFNYNFFAGHFNDLISSMDKFEYIYYIISKRRKTKYDITEKDYMSAFSCFQTIYNCFENSHEEENEMESILKDIKKEIKEVLYFLDEKYKGKNTLKRKFVKRFAELVEKSNVKLESSISLFLNEHDYIFNNMHELMFKDTKELLENLDNYVIDAVKDRDDITHNGVVKLSETSQLIYRSVVISCYIMIFEIIGIDKEIIKNNVQRMINHNYL